MSTASTCGYEILNVCRGESYKEALEIIKHAFSKPNYPHIILEGTPGDQFGIYGDNSGLLKAYNYVPETTLSTGIKKMADWFYAMQN